MLLPQEIMPQNFWLSDGISAEGHTNLETEQSYLFVLLSSGYCWEQSKCDLSTD